MSVDIAALRKGSRLTLKDGRTVIVQGLFMSSEGPVVMAKNAPSELTAQNVPVSEIESLEA